MGYGQQAGGALIVAVAAAFALSAAPTFPQGIPGPDAAPNPYRLDEGWAKLPAGRNWGRRSARRSIAATAEACGPSTAASSRRSAGTRISRRSFISMAPARRLRP